MYTHTNIICLKRDFNQRCRMSVTRNAARQHVYLFIALLVVSDVIVFLFSHHNNPLVLPFCPPF